MTREEAVIALRTMIVSLDKSDFEAAAAKLLERVSCRADSLELRAALVELGAAAFLRQAAREGGA
jgi:hypothetical protein